MKLKKSVSDTRNNLTIDKRGTKALELLSKAKKILKRDCIRRPNLRQLKKSRN